MKQNLINTIKISASTLAVGAILWLMAALGATLAKQAAEQNCTRLAAQAEEYKDAGFYLTKNEYEGCLSVGIDIVAPVSVN